MIYRPDLAHRPEGEVIMIGDRPHRHVGEGRYAPCEHEPLIKRFDVTEHDLLIKAA